MNKKISVWLALFLMIFVCAITFQLTVVFGGAFARDTDGIGEVLSEYTTTEATITEPVEETPAEEAAPAEDAPKKTTRKRTTKKAEE